MSENISVRIFFSRLCLKILQYVYFFPGFVSDQQTFFAGNTSSGNILQVFTLLTTSTSTGTRVVIISVLDIPVLQRIVSVLIDL
jgi:hypothetical protein